MGRTREVGSGARVLSLALALAAPSGCGGDAGPGPTPMPDPEADLSVTASAPSTVAVGATINVSIQVGNAGPTAASDVALVATLPAGASFVSASDGGSASGSQVSWSIGTIGDGQTASRTLTLTADAAGARTVTASATASTPDPDPSNNGGGAAASATFTVVVQADVRVSVAGPGALLPGDDATWTVTVANDGPSAAADVDVTLAFNAAPGGITPSDGGAQNGSTVSWPAVATIGAGASITRTVTAPTPPVGPVDATGAATASTNDPTSSNNDGSAAAARGRLIVGFASALTITGEAAGDQFGWVMDVVGDLDNDGANEFVISSPTNDAGGNNAGRAYVYSAATGQLIYTFTGTQPGAQFGHMVDGAGDVNNDGVPDIVVGAPFSANGRAVIFSGADGSVLYSIDGENAGDGFGTAVGRLGDVNGDGHDDVLITATGHDGGLANSGRVYVVSGIDGSVLVTKNSAASNSGFGTSVGGVGDLTADGVPDFGVGAQNAPGNGRIYVLNGATGDTVFFSVAADGSGGSLGQFWLNPVPDINDDGLPEIFAVDISDNQGGSLAGKAYVISGADGSKLLRLVGEAAGDQFGIGRGIADVTGDGKGDLFLVGWLNDEGAPNAGKGYVYSGADGSVVRTFTSTVAGENLGFDAIGLGDVTGDGIYDYLISGGISPSTPGHVHVVAGLP
ncbi:MAG: FG-GAP-like repeat-containing protein [Gemmatimonadota bacterium]